MVQQVRLNRGQVLTKDNILSTLSRARSGYNYAKFTMHNDIYITVFFNRDMTVEVTTNTRDLMLWNQIKNARMNNVPVSRLADLVFNWINMLNK